MPRLYEVLNLLDDFFTPGTAAFSEFVLWSSDDTIDFLRSRYRKKNEKLLDRRIFDEAAYALVAFKNPFCRENLCYLPNGPETAAGFYLIPQTRMQICFEMESLLKDDIIHNIELGYPFMHLFDLKRRSERKDVCYQILKSISEDADTASYLGRGRVEASVKYAAAMANLNRPYCI